MKFETVLFDLDGTLTDPYEGITNSILHSLKYYPEIPTPEREFLRPFIGPPLYASYEKYFGLSHEQAVQAVEHYREYFRPNGLFENKVYDGIPELLSELKKSGVKTLVATSKPEEFAVRILDHFDLSKYFDGIFGSTLDGKIIEKNDIVRMALEKSGADKNKTVMVGDTAFDIKGAHLCGVEGIGVTYGYGEREDILAENPLCIADTVEELKAALL